MSHSLNSQSYYDILEVDAKSPQDEIHRAYQRAKNTYSGNSPALYSMFSAEETKELLKLIEEAYSVLGNQESRSRYDSLIDNQKQGGPTIAPVSPMAPVANMPAQISAITDTHMPIAEKNAGTVPEGFSKTRFGIYEINPVFEEEVENCVEFSGEIVKQVRLYKKISLEDMSEHIRVSRTYINAIEMEDYDGLPAPVFIRGFVSQIAKVLGLDDAKVAKSYMARYKQSL